MKASDNETRWAKVGNIEFLAVVGKETALYGRGCHLIFINLVTNEELLYTANNSKNGDGIRCYAGHRTQNVFVYAEKKTNPTLFVKSYPNFEEICQLKDNEPRGYVSVAMAETSLLIAIGDLPNFNLTVWNWRLGEKIASHKGGILMDNQILKCNLTTPVFLTQLGKNSKEIRLWDMYICGKKCVLTEHTVTIQQKVEKFTGILWTSEGGCFVLDNKGCVYTMYPDHHLERVIEFTEEGKNPTCFAWYKFGIAVVGPNLEIRHYKKFGTWTINWTLIPPAPIYMVMARFEFFVGITVNSDVLQMIPTENTCKYIKSSESRFNDICLVNPMGKYLLALTHGHIINMYNVATGELKNSLDLKGKAGILVENPKLPYAVVGFEIGIIKLISAYNKDKLVKMTQFFLSRHPIDKIYFNESGTIFVVGHLTVGKFFIIEGLPGGHMDIVATIDAKCQIADFIIILSQDCYRIFTIPVTSSKYIAGNVVQRYCFIKKKGIDVKQYEFEENILYKQIAATSGTSRDRTFFLVPYENKTIHKIEIKKGEILAKVTQQIPTGHQVRGFQLNLNKKVAMTWGYDGFIVARSFDFKTNIGIALPHHRMEAGVKKAFLEPHEKYLISLGHDGILVCTNLMEKNINPKLKQELEERHNSPDFQLLFSRRTFGYVPTGIYEGKCYLEVEEMKKLDKERVQCEVERNSILQEFSSIQKELQILLTQNLEGPDNERLDYKEFNLNTTLFETKAAHYKLLRKATEIYLKNLMEAQNKISEFMIANYWNHMKVPGTSILGIFANFEVTNYVLRYPDPNREQILKWIRHQRGIERFLNELNTFHPWEPIPEDKLMVMISQRPMLPAKDEHLRVLSALEYDVPEIEEQEDIETKIAFSGSDIMRFIEVQDAHYLQNELQTYFQTELQWTISKSDCYKLKDHFNSSFDKIMVQKTKEMSNLKEKNNRLRHIVSELNYFSEEKFQVRIDDPRWEQIEDPILLTQVKDDEVPVKPYVSPSEQAIINAKAAEAERIRLLLLADDFRERALMAMMNGVLEVRWEDELRKDVPLPKCMIEKEPENFNEDDLRAVKDYEEKVKFLNSERERYKFLLRAEYAKLAHSVRDSIKRFNAKLSELLNFKLLVDSAISQESLKINRMKFFQHTRKVIMKREQEILRKMSINDEVIASLHKLMATLHESTNECRNIVESYQVKDKLLEKAFKRDFQDLSLVIQEQATKMYRKRPKVNFRAINSTTILHELGKCITNNTKPPLTLNPEGVEFLKQLDNLDMYSGIPTVLDEHTYALICKHRRLRVEFEIKFKSVQTQQAEAEATLSVFLKRLQNKKELQTKLHNELNGIRQELVNVMCDGYIQIVIPRGLVETPLTGSIEDFKDAVLICRKDVETINDIILRFGDNKIKALQQGMNFRRKILIMEWKHKKNRMLIQDLQEKLIDIEGVRLTKEIQYYLKTKDKEKAIPFETEVDMIKASYENTIQDRKDKVNRMKKQINSIKAHDKIVTGKIIELNVDVCDLNMSKDQELDVKERTAIDARMNALLKRSKIVQQIQDNHHEILMLQTELELLRLKTFPTLKYKVN